jgi:hypothetical protein
MSQSASRMARAAYLAERVGDDAVAVDPDGGAGA